MRIITIVTGILDNVRVIKFYCPLDDQDEIKIYFK